MSARKSWDIEAKPRSKPAQPVSPQAARPVRDMRDMKKPKPSQPSVPVSTKNVTIARGKKQRTTKPPPLKKRRQEKSRVLLIVLSALSVLLIGFAFYLIWLPTFRIQTVEASGMHYEDTRRLAQDALTGTHFMIVPRNSIFFIPEKDIRARILTAYPDIEAVSLSASGLQTLTLSSTGRTSAFIWCGITFEAPAPTCYEANAEGLLFKPALDSASSTALRVYAELATPADTPDYPLRGYIVGAYRIPDALRFVKAAKSLGANVVSVTIRADEADLRTQAGTRITYVLGKEDDAAGLAATTFPQLSVNDGSLQYVDLRFNNKVYFKRSGAPEPEIQ